MRIKSRGFIRVGVLALAVVLASARSIVAQLCLGKPAPSAAPVQVSGRYLSYPETQRESGVELGYASTSGLFGSTGIAVTTHYTPGGNATSGEVWFGGTMASSDSSIAFCPLTGLRYTRIPALNEVGVKVTDSDVAYSLGASIGVPLDAGSALQIVPFAGVYFQRHQYSPSVLGSSAGANNGLYEIGLAFLASRRLSIAPVVRNGFTFERSGRAAYGVMMSYGFGR